MNKPRCYAIVLVFITVLLLGFPASPILADTYNLDFQGNIVSNSRFLQLSSTFTVSGEGTIAIVGVRLSIEHPNPGILRIAIESPSGSIVVVHNQSGGSSANIEDVLYLDDLNDCPSSDTCVVIDGPGTVADFAGENPDGTWNLYANDLTGGPSTGLITGTVFAGGESAPWGTAIGTQLIINGPLIDSDGDGVPDEDDVCEGFDDTLDSDADGVPNGCDICQGFDDSVDVDGNGIPDGCDGCSDPGILDSNSAVCDGTSFGETCDAFRCDAGFTPSEPIVPICQAGLWTNVPTCEPLSCPICGEGTTLNPNTNECEADPVPQVTCGEGTILNENSECVPDPTEVIVCHKRRSTLSVSVNGLDGHLAHGDTEGPCE
jgi:subtilisin-like proprotein convertase family protein